MTIIGGNELFQEIEVFGAKAIFTNSRFEGQLPDIVYRYEIRGSDFDPSEILTLERNVLVNHVGTVLSLTPLLIDSQNSIYINGEEDGINFVGGNITLDDFIKKNSKK